MTRTPHSIRSINWKVRIPTDLAAAIEEQLWDAVHKRPKYGGRSKLIEEQLRIWLEGQRAAEQPGDIVQSMNNLIASGEEH